MTVSAIENFVQTTHNTSASTSGAVLGKDDFLKLLVTQMKNQDPMDPMDGTEYTAQLAQFSSLEALQNIDAEIQQLKTNQAAANNSRAADYLGKTVTAAGDSFDLAGGTTSDLRFRLTAGAAETYVKVYNGAGQYVTSIDNGARAAGEHLFTWDGLDSQGVAAPDGAYFIDVMAVDGNGHPVATETVFSGRATEINFRDDTAYIMVGGREVTLADIRKISS
ncbi:MAG: Flagellar basal-body rod modification protein FlgD [Olavius algarvensis Delta 4 endosymbiont]|nr:MAG: Flagellar basal-body rod modification protein FlgD [Olavius algarvensis Delta 4 endosymbiont]